MIKNTNHVKDTIHKYIGVRKVQQWIYYKLHMIGMASMYVTMVHLYYNFILYYTGDSFILEPLLVTALS